MKKRNLHYIPCVYLKGFSYYPEKNREAPIYVYDKETPKLYCSKIKSVAIEKNYYPDSVESNLGVIESFSDPILRKMRNGNIPDSYDKLIFSIFINVMITRVPHLRKILKGKIPKDTSKAIEENLEKVPDLKNRIEFSNRFEGVRNKIENHLYLRYGNPSIDMNLVSHLFFLKWIFYYVKSESKFITSDNPVTITKKGELFFPISSNICLVISRGNDREDSILVPEKYYKEINNITASNATRFIYYHEKKDWVKKIAFNKR